MTVIAALHQNGETWIGADSRATNADAILPASVSKWTIHSDRAIGSSGDALMNQILQRNAASILSASDPVDIADAVRDLVKDRFSHREDPGGGAKSWGNACIIATPEGVFDCDSAFMVVRIDSGTLWARGSGRDYALGVGFALGKFQSVSAEHRVIESVAAACKFDPNCGGPQFIHRLGAAPMRLSA